MPTSLFLVTQVPLGLIDNTYILDEHTCNDLVRWTQDVDRVIMACPLYPEERFKEFSQCNRLSKIAEMPNASRIEIVPLPYAYKTSDFIRHYSTTRQLLKNKIQESQYLCFLAAGLIGDWASVAAVEAISSGRRYAFLADRVEYEVVRRTLKDYPPLARIKEGLTLPLTQKFIHHLVQKSALGLFQGYDCYKTFSPYSDNAHCIYHTNTKKSDQISPEDLQAKLEKLRLGYPLKIGYVGRADAMKGAIDWVEIIHRIHQAGVKVEATWLGQGSLLPQMKQLAQQLGIESQIRFPGFVSDQQQVLEMMRQQNLLMFCHKTPESPRCLIESLVSGCPIVGYQSAYAEALVKTHGGGMFVDLNDQVTLAQQIIQLDQNRERLCQLTEQAAQSGQLYDQESTFQRRSTLLKTYLT